MSEPGIEATASRNSSINAVRIEVSCRHIQRRNSTGLNAGGRPGGRALPAPLDAVAGGLSRRWVTNGPARVAATLARDPRLALPLPSIQRNPNRPHSCRTKAVNYARW